MSKPQTSKESAEASAATKQTPEEKNAQTLLDLIENLKRFKTAFQNSKQSVNDKFSKFDSRINTINMFGAQGSGIGEPQINCFHGRQNEDIHAWPDHFELVANAYDFDDAKKCKVMPTYFREGALRHYKGLTEAEKGNYGQLKTQLKALLKPVEQSRWAQTALASTCQKDNESVQQFALRLEKLTKMAHPELTGAQQQSILRASFIAKLHKSIRTVVTAFEPATYEAALNKALCLEANELLEAGNYPANPKVLAIGPENSQNIEDEQETLTNSSFVPKIHAFGRRDQVSRQNWAQKQNFQPRENPNFEREFRQMQSDVRRLSMQQRAPQSRNFRSTDGNFSRSYKPARQLNWRDKSQITCYYCGKLGHIQADCRQRINQNPGGNRNRQFQGRFQSRNKPFQNRQYQSKKPQWRQKQPHVNVVGQKPDTSSWKLENDYLKTENDSLREQNEKLQQRFWANPGPKSVPVINAFKVNFSKTTAQQTDRSAKQQTENKQNDDTQQEHRLEAKNIAAEHEHKACHKTNKQLISKAIYSFLVLTCICFQVYPTSGTVHSYPYPQPMLCGTKGAGRTLWSLPKDIPCGKVAHGDSDNVTRVKITLFSQNLIQTKVTGHACQIVRQHTETFTYFGGQEHWKNDSTHFEPTTVLDCRRMYYHSRCKHGYLTKTGGMSRTTNVHKPKWGNWLFKCCKTYITDTYNCILHDVAIFKRHSSKSMEASVSDDVSECQYSTGECTLDDGTTLIWIPDRLDGCAYVYHSVIYGRKLGDSILSNDGNMAFTFTEQKTVSVCQQDNTQAQATVSDQGIVLQVEPDTRNTKGTHNRRVKRALKRLSRSAPADTAQLASQLQALEITTRENLKFTFQSLISSTCIAMNAITRALYNALVEIPTIGARTLLQTDTIFARSSAGLLEVFPCEPLNEGTYKLLPQTEPCNEFIPVRVTLNGKITFGHMNPGDMIIHQTPGPIQDCQLVRTIPLQIENDYFIYNSKTGALSLLDKHEIPYIPPLVNNMSYNFDFHSTIFHEIIFNNFTSYLSRITMNDMVQSVQWQRKLFRSIGIAEDGTSSGTETAAALVSKGYFSFLYGIFPWSPFQVWTFLVCVEVTVLTFLRLCCPLRLLDALAELTVPNTARNSWQWMKNQQLPDFRPMAAMQNRWTNPIVRFRKTPSGNQTVGIENTDKTKAEIAIEPELTVSSCQVESDVSHIAEVKALMPRDNQGNKENIPPNTNVFEEFIYTIDCQEQDRNLSLESAEVPICFNGTMIVTLIDTGASISILSEKLLPCLGIHKLEPCTLDKARSMTGNAIPIIGTALVEINFGGDIVISHTICVTSVDSDYPSIIGIDVLSKLHNVTFDFENACLQIGSFSIPMGTPKAPQKVKVCAVENITIPPRCEVLLKCKLSNTPDEGDCLLLTPNDEFMEKSQLHVAHSVCQNANTVPVQLVNITNKSTKIYAGTTVATAEVADVQYSQNYRQSSHTSSNTHSDRICKISTDKTIKSLTDDELIEMFDFSNAELSPLQVQELKALLLQYKSIFSRHKYDYGEVSVVKHRLKLTEGPPIKQRPYKVPGHMKPLVREELRELLNHGIIKASQAPWSSPLIPVIKPDDSLRLVVDFRRVNARLQKDAYPLPNASDMLSSISNANILSSI